MRRMLGRSCWKVPPGGSSQPRLLSNEALMEACSQPTIAELLQRLRGRWVGHVLRMPEYRLARQLFFGTIVTSAPPQSHPPLSLKACYVADVAPRFPRHILRTFDRPDLFLAAANKSYWNARF